MKLVLVAVGKKMPAWVNTACDEYSKRLGAYCEFNLQEVSAVRRTQSNNAEIIRSKEAEEIQKKISDHSRVITLDEHGQHCTTQEFAEKLSAWQLEGNKICFVIGGADGLSKEFIDRSDESLSLSKMTLAHGLARVVFLEQLYRAFTLLGNHPYHRA